MKAIRPLGIVAVSLGVMLSTAAFAEGTGNRTELKRVDLAGAPGMEVVSSLTVYQVGDVLGRHLHHGIESGYVVQGGKVQPPGKDPIELATGANILFERDVPHGGFKIVGDSPLTLYTVHVVDKGKPLYDWIK